MNKIDINKSVPSERWLEFFDQFADGNRGRHISIEILGSELGDEELIQNAPLMAMVYVGGASQNENPPKKGNKLTIETGKDEVTYAHTWLTDKSQSKSQTKLTQTGLERKRGVNCF